MNNFPLRALPQPEAESTDPLTDLLRVGARDLNAQAVGAEIQTLLEQLVVNNPPDLRPSRSAFACVDFDGSFLPAGLAT